MLKVCDLNTLSNDEKEHLRIFFVFRAKYNNRKRENIFKDIKIFAYQNLGTGEFIDLFVVDRNDDLVNLDKTTLNVKQ